jgi:hypothetical protein
MKRWQGSCIGAFLALLIGGGSLILAVRRLTQQIPAVGQVTSLS